MCLLSYFWNSENHLYWFVFSIDLGGGIIDLILCVITLIMLRKELSEHEKKKVEWMIESGAAIVALLVIVTVLGMARLNTLAEQGIRNEFSTVDWRKQRIYAFEATAIIVVRPLQPVKDIASLPKTPPNVETFPPQTESPKKEEGAVLLYLGRNVDIANDSYSRENAQIESDDAYRSATGDNLIRFDIHFGGHHEHFFENGVGNTWEFSNDSLTPADLDAIDILLPFRCEIVSGEVKMEIDNGLTNMVFQIPPQKTFVCAATSVATNGTFVPIDFSPEIRAEVAKSEEAEREKADAQAKFISRGIELESKAREGKSNDRTITDDQKDLFIKLLSEYPKTPVKVFVSAGDDEAGRYAQKIRQLLDAAKYGGDDAGIITNSNIIMEATNNEAWKPSSNMLAFVIYGDARAPFFVMARSPIAGANWGFSGIGLNGIYIPDNTILKPGEVGVAVLPKPK